MTELWIMFAVFVLAVAVLVWRWMRDDAPPPELELTEAGHLRWLRAGRPPFQWFLRLPEDQQEALARVGVEHSRDVAIAVGYAVRSPELQDATMNPDDEAAELSLLQRVAADTARKLMADQPVAEPPPPDSMGGVTSRREQAQVGRQQARDRTRRFLGRAPKGTPTA